jgi:GT2 family glycosyltransferase
MEKEKNIVSIILLSYNRPHLIKFSIESILNQTYQHLEIIIVDNKSPSSLEIQGIIKNYPQIMYVQNTSNTGFTGGMNKGLGLAKGEYIYFTEDDIVLDHECIMNLIKAANKHNNIGLYSPIMFNMSSDTIRCAGGEITFEPYYKIHIYGSNEADNGQFNKNRTVSFIPGASIFGSRTFLTQLKGFREDFFMYYEDVDLCLRTIKEGKNILVVSDAKVKHFEPQPSNFSRLVLFHREKNIIAIHIIYASWQTTILFIIKYTYRMFACKDSKFPENLTQFNDVLYWTIKKIPELLRDREKYKLIN